MSPTATTRGARRGVPSAQARFRDRATARRRRPWRRVLAFLLGASLLAAGGYVLGWTEVLGVREVRVSGVTGAERTAVAALVTVPLGTPLARVDTADVESAVRARVTVAEASVRRGWPNSLEVEVVPRTPAIVVKDPQGGLQVVDATGVAFDDVQKPPKGVPVVTATAAGAMTPAALQAALALLRDLPPDLAESVSAVTVSSANLVTFTMGRKKVVWGGEEQGELKVRVLRTLLTTKARTIDVSAPGTPVTR